MRESIFETFIGAIVVAVAGVFLWFALARGGDSSSAPADSVEIGARFSSVSGVDRGTDVRLAGVKVGTVRGIDVDYNRAEALVTMALSSELIPIEDGMSARIQSDGLLGGNYISLEPGTGFGQIEPCGPNQELFGESGCGEILYTQGSVDLLTLFASFASGSGGDSGGDTSSSSSSSSDGYPDDAGGYPDDTGYADTPPSPSAGSDNSGDADSEDDAGSSADAADDTESSESSASDEGSDPDPEQ